MIRIGNRISDEVLLNENKLADNILILGEDTEEIVESVVKQLIENDIKVLTIDMQEKVNNFNFNLYTQDGDFGFFHILTKLFLIAYKLDDKYCECVDFLFSLKDNDNLNIVSYAAKLKEITGIDLEILDQNNAISIEELLEENRTLHLNMKKDINKLVGLITLFDQISIYYKEHPSDELQLKHAVIVKGVSDIANNKIETMFNQFLCRIQTNQNVSVILCDNNVDFYTRDTLSCFSTKIIINYKNNLEALGRKIKFNKLTLSTSENVAFVQMSDEEYQILVDNNNAEGHLYSELFENELNKKRYSFLKLSNTYLIDDKYRVILGDEGIYFSRTFIHCLDAKEEKILEALGVILNKTFGYVKIAIIDHELQALYDDITINYSSIINFVQKLDKLIDVCKEIELQLNSLGVLS